MLLNEAGPSVQEMANLWGMMRIFGNSCKWLNIKRISWMVLYNYSFNTYFYINIISSIYSIYIAYIIIYIYINIYIYIFIILYYIKIILYYIIISDIVNIGILCSFDHFNSLL